MNKFMEIAYEEARKGITNGDGGPFGAVIVKDGKVLAKGHNTVILEKDPTCHGEINAIREASFKLFNFDLSGCELYTTHEPCPMCAGAIQWSNIDKVYYGCSIEDTETIGFRDKQFYEEANKYIQIDRDECNKLNEEYNNLDHIMY